MKENDKCSWWMTMLAEEPKSDISGGDGVDGTSKSNGAVQERRSVVKKELLKDSRLRRRTSADATAKVQSPIDPKTAAFFAAIREGNLPKVKSFVKARNMHFNTRDLDDPLHPTALLVACENDSTEMVKLFLTSKKAKVLDVNQEDAKGKRPLWVAAKNGNAEIANLLLNSKGVECDVNFIDRESGCSPLYRAIISNSAPVVQLLISAKADVNMRRLGYDVGAETPLIKAVQVDNKRICELLLNALCKLQAKTEDGLNALHFAVAYRRYDIAELLLENRIKIHAKSNHGITPMTVAIEHHNPAMVRMLIEYGYKMDKKYKWKETPLMQAINLHSEECAMTLIHWGCKITKEKGKSYFYQAVDEKLMRLTKFMTAIQPRVLQEEWIRTSTWPVSIYHRPDIFEWLEQESHQVRTLRQLCRGRIFRLLGKYPTTKIEKLPIPDQLKEYLKFRTHIKDEFYERRPLNVTGECPIDCPAICTRKYCPPIEVSSSEDSDSSIDDDEVLPIARRPVSRENCKSEHHQHEDKDKCCEYCK